jgi:hypothetical protein
MPTLNFDASKIVPSTPNTYDPIPKGVYDAMIIGSAVKQTNAGNGSYLELTFELISAPFTGRKIWSRLNLKNPNKKAEEIAERDLSAICHAVGKTHLGVSEELHNLPLSVMVHDSLNPSTGTVNNVIKGYAAIQRSSPGVTIRAAGTSTKKLAWQ